MTLTSDSFSRSLETYHNWSVDEVIEWTWSELQLNCSLPDESDTSINVGGSVKEDGRKNSDNEETSTEDKPLKKQEIEEGSEQMYVGSDTSACISPIIDPYSSIKSNFHENAITGDVLPFLSLEDCKRVFNNDTKLAVKFKVSINKLERVTNPTDRNDKELVNTLNNLHITISEKLQEYQSHYSRLRMDVLEVMKRSATNSAAFSSGTHPQQSIQVQDYFERPQHNHHSGYPSPISPRNHPVTGPLQRRASSSTAPNVGQQSGMSSTTALGGSAGNSSSQLANNTSPNEPLKQLRASKEDSTEKILKNAMKKHNLNEVDWRQYVLVICYGDQERILEMDEQPVVIFKNLRQQGLHPAIMLRQKGDFEEVGDLTPGGRL
ncbi:Ste50p Ecym_1048 [Eremothecium cymbalariae DBVPG|uniref:Ras-associating domain-containing protein n=1 Tax=Eremothecium cymbalariae (strain CBS 270.75 / DBVPG 7215 / KCTC 17166 / NRRL Y-17582) TaxID=931890 RepID=G8JM97_ERECY|nr:hypothetical protein Ecym_1048 [Eremothecium cymbalariae DBVPG\